MINPANRTKSIKLSQIRKMFEVTNPNAINLGIGEPDFDVPKNIKDAMKKSIDDNDTHYTPNKGYIELREAICDKFKKDNQIDTTPEDVIVTVGASEGLYLCAQAFIEKGDEVILPNPSFLSYEATTTLGCSFVRDSMSAIASSRRPVTRTRPSASLRSGLAVAPKPSFQWPINVRAISR